MKNMKKKPILALALIALLLIVTVSGTLAYLIASTGTVVNTFKPTQVSVTVTDDTEDKIKDNVVITNTSNIDVYIRAAIVGNWQNADGFVVDAWNGDIPAVNGWTKGSDGYYYYTQKVAPKAVLNTANGNALFDSYTALAPQPNLFGETAEHLQLDILVQAIQAEPTTAVESVWPVTVREGGALSLKGN